MTLFQIKSGHNRNNYLFSIGEPFNSKGYYHTIGRYHNQCTGNYNINVLKEL